MPTRVGVYSPNKASKPPNRTGRAPNRGGRPGSRAGMAPYRDENRKPHKKDNTGDL